MKLFNKENPTKKTSVIATLTAHYGDDGLAKIVEGAKQVRSSAALAKRVQAEQVQRWLVDGKTPTDVFALLKLDAAGAGLFTQPQVVTWAKYLDDFNKANPESATTLFSFLKTRYKEEPLVHMLLAAKKVPSTDKIAVRIQAEQTNLWLAMKKEPADVFKLLKLDDVGLPLLKSSLFDAWVKYTDDFRKEYFGTKLTTISILREFYRDDVLATMILTASKSSSTSTSDLAKRLYTEQLRNWYLSKFAPEHVFKLLRLGTADVPLFENQLFNVWTKFMVYFGDLRPKEDISLLTVLMKVCSERDVSKVLVAAWDAPRTKPLATKLLGAQLDRWLVAQRDPVEVFFLLHVEGAAAKDVRKLLYNKYRQSFNQLRRAPVRNKA
ncbi:hypothetical protein PHYPSEUDO_010823 [Phytophthora pseudosyringae]|uniref:RxLR effector PexRD54 WY domain-containing protein n=1 Tax=Phytophthora pseudosyringae TaxID=221518 RepID=A0A8T1W7D0_9STRA|nr:hypothetical protein PHYPSEUDO_010823 [Phytophthora pseudosyringae]